MKFDIPLIGITGSNGKTTAKEMVYRVLDAKFRVLKNEGTQNNLIGVPQTLLKLKSGHDIAVMEMGTNHFGEIKRLSNILSPSVGIITNIGASHLEFLDSESGVLREKMALPRSLKKNNIAILNADDRMLSRARNLKCRVIRFGIGNESDFTATDIIRKDNEMDFMVNNEYPFRLRLLGEHNIYNALIAITIGFLCRIEHRRIYNALYEFEPVKGRLCLRVAGGIHIIDDTYNSNPCSLKTAVTTLSGYRCAGRKIFIFGDMLELGPAAHRFHHEAGRLVSGAGIHCLISVGSFGDIVRDSALSGGMGKETVFSCRDNASVLAVLKKIIREDDAVLLKGSRLLKLDEVVNALLSSIPSKRDMVRL
jgi:UDP-N-acetylmuramoyl-tripeptide--D-alanyl-D-alanine ligase